MRIWHVGATRNPETVNGVDAAIWAIARQQVLDGNRVSLVLNSASTLAEARARELGMNIVEFSDSLRRPIAADVVHTHSVFAPRHAALSLRCRMQRIPYVVSPHGGLSSHILERHSMPKRCYRKLIEAPRFRSAAGWALVAQREFDDVSGFTGIASVSTATVGNPLPVMPAIGDERGDSAVEDVVYLGRGDVHGKGIDRLLAVALQRPTLRFGIYGPSSFSESISLPPNVAVHPPVFGEDKWRVLRSARAFVHLARWEVFGIAPLEAMAMGTPVVISREPYLADWFAEQGEQAVDGANAMAVALALDTALASRSTENDARRSAAARQLGSPAMVAQRLQALYGAALKGNERCE